MERKSSNPLPQTTITHSKNLFDLSDKVCMITGASGTLGRALAYGLSTMGAELVLSGRNEEKLNSIASEVSNLGSSALVIPADVTRESEVRRLTEETVSKLRKIDILVSCSGTNMLHRAVDYPVGDFEKIMNINALGTFLSNREVGKTMIEQKHGKIVNISSIRGWFATSANVVAYSASKAAVNMITRSLACEWARYNVQVNAIAPAMVGGGMHISTPDGKASPMDPKILEGIAKRTPMKRLATPEDLVGPVIFLASDASNFVTGQIIYVDGGASVWAA